MDGLRDEMRAVYLAYAEVRGRRVPRAGNTAHPYALK
jgi:hypothetical protein